MKAVKTIRKNNYPRVINTETVKTKTKIKLNHLYEPKFLSLSYVSALLPLKCASSPSKLSPLL